MKEVSAQSLQFPAPDSYTRGRPVERVADDGVADRREVDADLVGAPGQRLDFEQREVGEAPQRTIPGCGLAGPDASGPHAHAVDGVAADGLHNLAARARYTPVNERDIRLVYFPLFELRRELPVSKVVLGHEHQTRSHLVQAMDDPWAQFPSRSGKAADVVQQGVDQRAGFHPGAHVHHHSGGLIYDHQIVVFVDDRERQVFRHRAQFTARRADADAVAGCEGLAGLVDRPRSNRDQARADLPLELAAAPLRLGHDWTADGLQG